jgi:NAD(P)H dehydrogenase (quinone)
MIVITGATGALNGRTVDLLLARGMPAEEVVVVTRDAARAGRFADRGLVVRQGDYADPTSLQEAFEGADQLLLVSSNDPAADTVDLHRNAVQAAVTVGAGRVLYTSHQGAAADSPFAPARVHAATEELLAASGLPWTALRNGFYAHSLTWLTGDWRGTGRIEVPADGPISWTSRDDAAEAAAVLLTAPSPHDGPVTLTAAAAPTFAEVAQTACDLAGRPVECVIVDQQEWLATKVAAGQPEGAARFTLGIYQAAAAGLFAGTDPTLQQLLGRAPKTIRDALEG